MAKNMKALRIMRERYQEMLTEKSDMWTAAVGHSVIRVAPAWKPKGLFYKEVDVHFRLGPEQNRFAVCSTKNCPSDLRSAKLSASDNPKKQKRAERFAPRHQAVMNVCLIKENGKKIKKKRWQLWATSIPNLGNFLSALNDPNTDNFFSPKKDGYNWHVYRKGLKMRTRYTIKIDSKPSRFKAWKKLKGKMIDIDARYKPMTREKIKAILEGKDSKD